MASFGVLPQGFVLKRQSDIIDELNNAWRAAFGQDLDVSADTPNGQIIGIMSTPIAQAWLLGQSCYDAFNPNTAFGISLSNVIQINYLERQEPSQSEVEVTLTGTPGTVISAATSIIQTNDTGNPFIFQSDITIPGSGTIDVQALSQQFGPISAPAGTLTVIATPIPGWFTVNNAQDATLGRTQETDPQVRVRRQNSTTFQTQNIEDAQLTAILSVNGVLDARVYVNDTDNTDSNGLVPHSTAAVVNGGDETDIANAIKNNFCSSIPTNGNISVLLPNSAGILQPILFFRPQLLDIHIQIEVTPLVGFPQDGLFQIEQAVFDFTKGFDSCTGEDTGTPAFNIGEDVIVSQLFTPINTVPNQSVQQITLGIGSPSGTTDIPIPFDGLSSFNIDNIVAVAV